MRDYAGLKIVVVKPPRIWVKRLWRERLFNTDCGWRPFAKMKLVDGETHIPLDKSYIFNDTLYCGPVFYDALVKQLKLQPGTKFIQQFGHDRI